MMARHRWLVRTEKWHLLSMFLMPPIVSFRYYRWRWMARHACWFNNNLPPLGIPIVVKSALLGKVCPVDSTLTP